MSDTNNIILYVNDAEASARFYSSVLELEAIQAVPGFALFALPSGLRLGLWNRDGVQPAPEAGSGGSEVGFQVGDAASVDAMSEAWAGRGVEIALRPTDMPFGRTFVGRDPDGHRLRVYALADGM